MQVAFGRVRRKTAPTGTGATRVESIIYTYGDGIVESTFSGLSINTTGA